jgi:hypothetical protein
MIVRSAASIADRQLAGRRMPWRADAVVTFQRAVESRRAQPIMGFRIF